MDAEQAKAKEIEALQEQLQNLKDMAAGKAVSASVGTKAPFPESQRVASCLSLLNSYKPIFTDVFCAAVFCRGCWV